MDAVLMPRDPPVALCDGFDEEIFSLCRDYDYAGIYRLFVERYQLKIVDNNVRLMKG